MIKPDEFVENRTRDLAAWSIMPQRITLPHSPTYVQIIFQVLFSYQHASIALPTRSGGNLWSHIVRRCKAGMSAGKPLLWPKFLTVFIRSSRILGEYFDLRHLNRHIQINNNVIKSIIQCNMNIRYFILLRSHVLNIMGHFWKEYIKRICFKIVSKL
jgi:hypothetical protein